MPKIGQKPGMVRREVSSGTASASSGRPPMSMVQPVSAEIGMATGSFLNSTTPMAQHHAPRSMQTTPAGACSRPSRLPPTSTTIPDRPSSRPITERAVIRSPRKRMDSSVDHRGMV